MLRLLLLLLLPSALRCAEQQPSAATEAAELAPAPYASSYRLPAYVHRPTAAALAAARLARRAAAALATLQPLAPQPSLAHLLGKVLPPEPLPWAPPPPRVLVTYAYTDSPCARRNLAHFLRHGLAPALQDGTPIDYSFVLQGRNPTDIFRAAGVPYTTPHRAPDRQAQGTERENAPPSAGDFEGSTPLVRLYLLTEAHGLDAARNYVCAARLAWEHGWVPTAAAPGAYTHFVLLNGAARGPFLPAFARVLGLSWVDVALHALTSSRHPGMANVHAVGTSIDCVSGAAAALVSAAQAAAAVPNTTASGAPPQQPSSPFPALHLHPTMLALDAEGVQAVSAHLRCYDTAAEAQWQGVVGLTQGVLSSGGRVLALQGLWGGQPLGLEDLSSPATAARCSAAGEAGGDSAAPGALAGGSLHPLDAMFVGCGQGMGWGGERELDRLSELEDRFS